MRAARRRPRAAASVVVPFPRSPGGDRLALARVVPSGRSLALGAALLAAAGLAILAARSSGLFAVEEVQVLGAPAPLERDVRRALRDVPGRSLLGVDAGELEQVVGALPEVAGVSVDRAFPHTLVVRVAPERPVAVARQGRAAWLVTGRGEVIREIAPGTERGLPRLWLARDVPVRLGGTLPPELLPAARALAALRQVALPRRVKAVRLAGGEVALVLRSGLEVRLGGPTDLRLKLAVAARVFPLLAEGTTYLDVSVPERPVAGSKSQVSG